MRVVWPAFVVTLIVFWFLFGAWLRDVHPVEIRVSPQTLFVGGSLDLRCRAQRHPANRWLHFGLRDYRLSTEDLHGDESPITFPTQRYDHVPCEVYEAVCAVERTDHTTTQATAPITVAGCDP